MPFKRNLMSIHNYKIDTYKLEVGPQLGTRFARVNYRNFSQFPNVEILWKLTISNKFPDHEIR